MIDHYSLVSRFPTYLSCPLGEEEGREGDDLDSDVKEKLTDEEAEIRGYLLHGDTLSEETIEKYASQFWNSDAYKSV